MVFFISNEYRFLDISVGGHENSRLACCSLSLSSICMTTAIIGEENYYETDCGKQRISDNNLLIGAKTYLRGPEKELACFALSMK